MTNQASPFGGPRPLLRIPVDRIEVGERLRVIDADYARMLAESIRAIGLTSPVEVRPISENRYKLVAGGHRYAAITALGHAEIDAFVVEVGDLMAELREIDENLVRHELNFLDRAAFLVRRKAIHETLYPAAKHGGDRGNQHTGGRQRQDEIVAFCQATALAAGYSPRTIQLAIQFYERLAPAARERLRASPIARDQSQLIRLSRLSAEEQVQVLDRMQAPNGPARVQQAVDQVLGKPERQESAGDKGFGLLVDLWSRTSKRGRTAFIAWLREHGEI